MDIHWRLLVDAKTEAKALQTYQRVAAALGHTAALDGLGSYPGKPLPHEGFEMSFHVVVDDASWAEAVLESLTLAQRVGYGWVITGDVRDTFEGIATKFRMPGCTFAEFQLQRPIASNLDAELAIM